MTTRISAVLPLKTKGRHYAENIGRCDILFASLRHFAGPDLFDRILLIVPSDEYEAAQHYAEAWRDFPIEVIDEGQHFGIFAEFSLPHQVRPWHRQQIIKLAAAEMVDTEYFMVLDPDVFALRPFDVDVLVPGGRALTHMQPREREARYWHASSAILQVDPHMDRDALWWTPTLLSRTLCRSLHRRLEEVHGTDWRRVLLARYMVDWTEFTLYWLNAEHQGLLDRYHVAPAPGALDLHADASVWFSDSKGSGLEAWNPAQHFAPDSRGLFAVVQSNTRIPVTQVADALRPYFPITLQPADTRRHLGLRAAEIYGAVTRRVLRSVGVRNVSAGA